MVVAGPVGWECDSEATGQLRMGPLWTLELLGHSCSDTVHGQCWHRGETWVIRLNEVTNGGNVCAWVGRRGDWLRSCAPPLDFIHCMLTIVPVPAAIQRELRPSKNS